MDTQSSLGLIKRTKKRRSTYQQAMKFSKRGKFGHGFQVQDEDFQYFLNILKVTNETFGNDEDKRIFADNVFKQLNGNEVNYCCNQVVSRVVDDLLPAASDETVLNLIKHFEVDLRPICSDQFASHVLQQLLHVSIYRAYKVTEDISETTKENYFNFINKLCKFIINNLEEFVWDKYANHVVRSCIACLCGKPYLCSKTPQQNGEDIDTNKDHKNLLKKYFDYIINIQQFSEMLTTDKTSGLLQVLLKSISPISKKRYKALVEKIMSECFPNDESCSFDNVSQVLENSSFSRILDVIITESSDELNTLLYDKYFHDKFGNLAVHHNGNFTLQKILSTTVDVTKFETIFDQIKENMSQIINLSYTGVLLELSKACLRLKSKQALFFKTLCESLKCKEETEDGITVLILLGLKVVDNINDLSKELLINTHGSMIVQNILKFNKPIKMVNNLNNLNTERLVDLLCNVKGSYIADAYFESAFIGERSREKLIWKLKDYYSTLAESKSGSRAFDCIWKIADSKQHIMIMTELLKHEPRLRGTTFGYIIASKLDLGMFRHNKDEWIKADQEKLKTVKVFEINKNIS
ncbi:nucleolar protein 9 [Melanaphis sacchari]|uniref:Pumilio domain-containing protein C14orf21 n=1 Tax=Melanaphis sacchari TaxID=742174 RepID=A0A2H8TF14_9HEMI|nr:nucleolar protein 9 [Melanaphis sacchari]